MSKPPTFIECSVCGREFGSKSIRIHEPQCLAKLRRTEIKEEETMIKPRRKKKNSPSQQGHSNNQTSIGTSSNKKVVLPNIHDNYLVYSSHPSSARPTTATLDRPKVLNPDYSHYDMSLTRIDFTTSPTLPGVDGNQNQTTSRESPIFAVSGESRFSPFSLPVMSASKEQQVSGTDSKLEEYTSPTLPPRVTGNYGNVTDALLGQPITGRPMYSSHGLGQDILNSSKPDPSSQLSPPSPCVLQPTNLHNDITDAKNPQIVLPRPEIEPNEELFLTPSESATCVQQLAPEELPDLDSSDPSCSTSVSVIYVNPSQGSPQDAAPDRSSNDSRPPTGIETIMQPIDGGDCGGSISDNNAVFIDNIVEQEDDTPTLFNQLIKYVMGVDDQILSKDANESQLPSQVDSDVGGDVKDELKELNFPPPTGDVVVEARIMTFEHDSLDPKALQMENSTNNNIITSQSSTELCNVAINDNDNFTLSTGINTLQSSSIVSPQDDEIQQSSDRLDLQGDIKVINTESGNVEAEPEALLATVPVASPQLETSIELDRQDPSEYELFRNARFHLSNEKTEVDSSVTFGEDVENAHEPGTEETLSDTEEGPLSLRRIVSSRTLVRTGSRLWQTKHLLSDRDKFTENVNEKESPRPECDIEKKEENKNRPSKKVVEQTNVPAASVDSKEKFPHDISVKKTLRCKRNIGQVTQKRSEKLPRPLLVAKKTKPRPATTINSMRKTSPLNVQMPSKGSSVKHKFEVRDTVTIWEGSGAPSKHSESSDSDADVSVQEKSKTTGDNKMNFHKPGKGSLKKKATKPGKVKGNELEKQELVENIVTSLCRLGNLHSQKNVEVHFVEVKDKKPEKSNSAKSTQPRPRSTPTPITQIEDTFSDDPYDEDQPPPHTSPGEVARLNKMLEWAVNKQDKKPSRPTFAFYDSTKPMKPVEINDTPQHGFRSSTARRLAVPKWKTLAEKLKLSSQSLSSSKDVRPLEKRPSRWAKIEPANPLSNFGDNRSSSFAEPRPKSQKSVAGSQPTTAKPSVLKSVKRKTNQTMSMPIVQYPLSKEEDTAVQYSLKHDAYHHEIVKELEITTDESENDYDMALKSAQVTKSLLKGTPLRKKLPPDNTSTDSMYPTSTGGSSFTSIHRDNDHFPGKNHVKKSAKNTSETKPMERGEKSDQSLKSKLKKVRVTAMDSADQIQLSYKFTANHKPESKDNQEFLSFKNVTLMVPNQPMKENQNSVDLNIIVRRKNRKGKYPELDEIVPQMDPGTFYILVDDENSLRSNLSGNKQGSANKQKSEIKEESAKQGEQRQLLNYSVVRKKVGLFEIRSLGKVYPQQEKVDEECQNEGNRRSRSRSKSRDLSRRSSRLLRSIRSSKSVDVDTWGLQILHSSDKQEYEIREDDDDDELDPAIQQQEAEFVNLGRFL